MINSCVENGDDHDTDQDRDHAVGHDFHHAVVRAVDVGVLHEFGLHTGKGGKHGEAVNEIGDGSAERRKSDVGVVHGHSFQSGTGFAVDYTLSGGGAPRASETGGTTGPWLTPSRAAISCSDGISSPGSVRRNGFVPSSPAESGSTAAPRFAGQEPLRPPSRTVVWTTGHIYIPEFPVNRNFHFDAKGWPRWAFASFQSCMTVSGETLNNPTFFAIAGAAA